MTKVSPTMPFNEQWPKPLDVSAELPDVETTGFCQLLTESGVPHVDGMEILRLVKMCAGGV